MEEEIKKQEDMGDAMPAQTGMAEPAAEPATPTKKESYLKNFKEKHPEWSEDDEEGFYGALTDDAAAYDEEMNGYKTREDEINTALGGSPMNAALFVDAANGVPVPLALIKRFPEEIRAWMDDPENADALKKTFEEHAAMIEENNKLQKEAEANLSETNQILDDMVANGEATDEEINQAIEFLGKIASGLMVNHIEPEWIKAGLNAIRHDDDVAAAKAQGEIDGRNAKISAQRVESSKGQNNHTALGSSNAGRNNGSPVTSSTKKDMWAGMKTNKLN